MKRSFKQPRRRALAIARATEALENRTLLSITSGLQSDFENGTTQGWTGNSSPRNIASGGPAGTGDAFLQIGGGNRFATFNEGTQYSGAIQSNVIAIDAHLMRPTSDSSNLEMRIVLFGPSRNDRWTSTTAHVVPNDGVWRTYRFSILEADLTRVLGSNSYANLAADVDRVMFRHDPGTPSATGISTAGTLGIDNVTVVASQPTAGFDVQITGGSTVVSESGRTDTFSVILENAPSSNVNFNITSSDTGEVQPLEGTLTFTPANWDTPQTVTVVGQADAVVGDGDVVSQITVAVDAATSDAAFAGLASETVDVTTFDMTPFNITLSGRGTFNDFIDITGNRPALELRRASPNTFLSTGLQTSSRISLAGYAAGDYTLWADGDRASFEVSIQLNGTNEDRAIPAIDLDGSGSFLFANDGVLLLAHALGTTGDDLNPFVGDQATRTGDSIEQVVNQLVDSLDIDGDGQFRFASDGIILLAHALGTAGPGLDPFASADATRTGAEMDARIMDLQASTPTGSRIQSPDVSEEVVFTESRAQFSTFAEPYQRHTDWLTALAIPASSAEPDGAAGLATSATEYANDVATVEVVAGEDVLDGVYIDLPTLTGLG